MSSLWFAVGTGVAFAVVIPLVRRVAFRIGAVSGPNPNIPSHRRVVPLLGGTALLTVYVIAVVVHRMAGGDSPDPGAQARLAAVFGFMAIGTLDDLRPFRPASKLLWQAVLCSIYLWAADQNLEPTVMVVHLACLLIAVNAYNLVDVMDGLLGVLACVAVAALILHPSSPPTARLEHSVLLIGLLVVLWFNRPPARLFLGDAGSLPLGFLIGAELLAMMSDLGFTEGAPVIGVAAVPLLEMVLVVTARLRQGHSPLLTSPDHFALRLQEQLGWTQRRVLVVVSGAASFWALGGWLQDVRPSVRAAHAAASVVLAVALFWCCWRIAPSPHDPRHSPPVRDWLTRSQWPRTADPT